MGQCEHFARQSSRSWKSSRPIRQPRAAAHCLPDGPLRANCLSITVHEKGPCECMCVIALRLLWANASISLGSHPAYGKVVGPYDSLVQQPTVCPMGHYELIV